MSNDQEIFSSYRTPIKDVVVNESKDSFLECLEEIKPSIQEIVGDLRGQFHEIRNQVDQRRKEVKKKDERKKSYLDKNSNDEVEVRKESTFLRVKERNWTCHTNSQQVNKKMEIKENHTNVFLNWKKPTSNMQPQNHKQKEMKMLIQQIGKRY